MASFFAKLTKKTVTNVTALGRKPVFTFGYKGYKGYTSYKGYKGYTYYALLMRFVTFVTFVTSF